MRVLLAAGQEGTGGWEGEGLVKGAGGSRKTEGREGDGEAAQSPPVAAAVGWGDSGPVLRESEGGVEERRGSARGIVALVYRQDLQGVAGTGREGRMSLLPETEAVQQQ